MLRVRGQLPLVQRSLLGMVVALTFAAALGAHPANAATYSSPEWWPLRGENLVGCARYGTGTICGGSYHSWWAIDIEGPANQDVHASGSGTASVYSTASTCSGGGYGNAVVVDHGPYGKSLYGHLSSISITNGQQVGTGTVIGHMGGTGHTEPCGYVHLHYEETTGSFGAGARDPGALKACQGNTLVSYPSQWGYPSWSGLPGHSLHAENDGVACAAQPPASDDADDDGVPDAGDACPTRDGPASNDGCPSLATATALTLGSRSIVSADFNGDGYDDLAVGAPGEDVGGATNAGAVFVDYGGRSGLGSTGRTQLYSGAGGLGNTPESGDMLGAALAAGDFNGDGFDDLAIGAPGEDSDATDGGIVLTINGSANGLDPATAGGGRQGGFFPNTDENGDYLGASLTAGDFNNDGYDDLAAGAPGENSSAVDGGIVYTRSGSPTGLAGGTGGGGRQGGLFANDDEDGDYLGASLTAGDFNGDGYDDLAAGAPGENSNVTDGGIVLTVNGSPSGLDPTSAGGGRQGGFFPNTDEANDYLGASLTAGDFNGDGFDDLAAGTPGENSSVADGGIVYTRSGSPTGLAGGTAGGGRQGGFFPNTDEAGDYLGASLTAGDFDGDGYDDLAAGAPGESSSVVDGGIVYTRTGSPTGLAGGTAGGGRQGGLFANADEDGDYLGASLAAGDFNGDCSHDLAAGAPGEDSSVPDGGAVLTVNGSVSGLAATTAGGGRQGGFFAGTDEPGDYLGGGSNGGNPPPAYANTGAAEPPSGNVAPPPGGATPRPNCTAKPSDPGSGPTPPPPGGGQAPASFGARTRVTLRLTTTQIRRRGSLKIRLTNQNDFAITGRISARTASSRGASHRPLAALKAKSFNLGPHTKTTIRLKTSKRLFRGLARQGRLLLRLTARVNDPAGSTRTLRKLVTLRLEPHRRR